MEIKSILEKGPELRDLLVSGSRPELQVFYFQVTGNCHILLGNDGSPWMKMGHFTYVYQGSFEIISHVLKIDVLKMVASGNGENWRTFYETSSFFLKHDGSKTLW